MLAVLPALLPPTASKVVAVFAAIVFVISLVLILKNESKLRRETNDINFILEDLYKILRQIRDVETKLMISFIPTFAAKYKTVDMEEIIKFASRNLEFEKVKQSNKKLQSAHKRLIILQSEVMNNELDNAISDEQSYRDGIQKFEIFKMTLHERHELNYEDAKLSEEKSKKYQITLRQKQQAITKIIAKLCHNPSKSLKYELEKENG